MIRMHANKNEMLIILNIDSVITEFKTLNCDDTKDRAKNRKNINTYLSARLNQYSEIFENDNSVKNNDQNKNSEKDFYAVISDEKFDRKMNNLIDQNYTQQEKIFIMKSENTIHENENEKKRREHQLSIDVFSIKRRT